MENYQEELLEKILDVTYGKHVPERIGKYRNIENLIKNSISYIDKKNKNYLLYGNHLFDMFNIYLKEKTLLDLFNIEIKINEKNYPLENHLIRNCKSALGKAITIENLQKCYEKDPEKTWEVILKLNKKDYLDDIIIDFITKTYELKNNTSKTEQLLDTICSFKILSLFEKNGFNIWKTAYKDKDKTIRTLLPFLVFEKESLRKDTIDFKKTFNIEKVNKIIKDKEIWQNITDFDLKLSKTRFIYCVSNFSKNVKDKNIKEYIKLLDIKKNDILPYEEDYSIAKNKKQNLKEKLFETNRIGILNGFIHKQDKIIDDNQEKCALSKLLTWNLPTVLDFNAKSNKNTFLKLWNDTITNTNFNDFKNGHNILGQIIKKNPKALPSIHIYFPLRYFSLNQKTEYDVDSFYHISQKEEGFNHSITKILTLFKENNVDFKYENNEIPILSDLILAFFSYNYEISNKDLFKKDGIIWNEYANLKLDSKIKIWEDFSNNWNLIFSKRKKDSYDNIYKNCKYENESLIVNVMKMFFENLLSNFDYQAKNTEAIYNDLLIYKESKIFAEILKNLDMLNQKNILINVLEKKEKIENKKINKI